MLKKLNFIIWIVVIVLILGIGAYFYWQVTQPKDPYYINLDQAAVVKEMRELSRLETATFTLEKIVEAGKTTTTGTKLEEFLVGDKLLLIANGQVIAGFNLENMAEEDIKIEGSSIEIDLPPPQILVSKLDNEKTKVYDRDTGVFTKGDQDLESEARKNAEISIRQAACEADILEQAKNNGNKQVTALLKAFGFESITINIPDGVCQ
jgi:hypothetical protein